MLLRLRVSLPDRPGVLGQVARAFGVMGADILQVTVLERQAGRAVDDFTVSWSGVFEPEELRERIGVVPGTRVEAVWPTREAPGTSPDYDLLGHVAGEPDRAFVTLVDAVPDLVSAEWAVAVDSENGAIVHGSWQAPEEVPSPELTPIRPSAFTEGTLHLVSVPMSGLHLVVARSQGPAFHRAELDKISRLVGIVSVLARSGVTRTA
ncbi:amino acid-binding protein [Planotetraspora sp. A-T 1434]|uniref:amino acid-binding protein n=1 Tax=Planotetraspora sp. A-T 1434 TaxID=2979219 RepID=UPI0021C1B69A|nr:amino acid-binding protein [Planotetraspora sp. A-T 1434]MCT9933361.1 amino acid-binding protein [Planotetraspora sp. A-T 1434]